MIGWLLGHVVVAVTAAIVVGAAAEALGGSWRMGVGCLAGSAIAVIVLAWERRDRW